jgi:lipoyl(octanoyl) transferase
MVEFLYDNLVDYELSNKVMKERVKSIRLQEKKELIWGLQHPSLYTRGLSFKQDHPHEENLLYQTQFPIFDTERGGQYTYHGVGQLVVYVMIDLLKRNKKDLNWYIQTLERWCVESLLSVVDINFITSQEAPGVFLHSNNSLKKIAFIGLRVTKWITSHGISININPNLEHFASIIPCGMPNLKITSLATLGRTISCERFFQIMKEKCPF